MPSPFDISIVIPAKDEEKRLPVFLRTVIDYCQASRFRYEIIVVDDGSRDGTAHAASFFQAEFKDLKIIRLPQNRGKGHAVKRGLMVSQGNIALFLDADGSTPVTEIEDNLGFFQQGYDIVIGSRVMEDRHRSVKTRAYRKGMGIIFNWLVQLFLIHGIQDTQCGFKMFRKSILRPLWSRVYLDGFGFDLEVLYLAQKMDYKIKEVPVNWTHVDGSKVRLLADSWGMLVNIFQINNWHYVSINRTAQHMSVEELANMYKQEKDLWWFQAKGEFVRTILRQASLSPQTILDAGCGTGHNMKFLDTGRSFYVGCDITREALLFCRQNSIRNLVQCDLGGDMGLKPKTFDLVLSLDVLEHLEDPYAALVQSVKLLKDDGKMLIMVPAFRFLWSPHDESLSHFRRYDRRDLGLLLTEAGLRIEKEGYLFCSTFLPVAIVRIIRKIFVKSENPQCDTYHSPPALINKIMLAILKIEARLLTRFSFPFGTSIYAVVSKFPT